MEKASLKILLAFDGSSQSEAVVRYTAGMLPAGSMELTLFHIADQIPDIYFDAEGSPAHNARVQAYEAWAAKRKTIMAKTMEHAKRLAVEAGVPEDMVTIRVQQKAVGVARDIAAEAHTGYDALVLGRTGHSRLKDLFMGSIATKILAKLQGTPVWLVGGAPKPGKILLAIDNSEDAMAGVDYVGRILGGTACKILLLHCRRSPMLFHTEAEQDWVIHYNRDVDRIKGDTDSVIEEATVRLTGAGVDAANITGRILMDVESRAGAIVEQAQKNKIGTIAMGRRGITRVEEFLLGRVSHKVLQMARDKALWMVG